MTGFTNWGKTVAFAALLLLGAGAAVAQTSTGNIYAAVTDEQGAALPGVTVTVSGIGAPMIQVTNAQGQARFLSLAPGNYRLEAALEGFSTLVFETVNVRTAQNTQLELKLSPAVEDVITVTAESPLLDERKISTGSSVNATELEKVPTSRDPWAVLGTVPGVKTDRINVGGNESGQQSQYVGPGSGGDQAVWAIDGVVITDMGAIGSSPTYYNFDAFEEMQVSTGGSDTSAATGGVTLNMVTKRGTNEWRGSGRYITADDSWQSDSDVDQSDLGQAGPWNDTSTAVAGGTFPNGVAQPIFKQGNRIVSIEDWGIEAGGPIVKDRLWIWGNYGVQDIQLLTVADLHDNTELDTYGAKLNAQITANNSAVLFYNYGDKQKQGRNAGPTRPQATTWNQTGPSDIYKAEDTQIFGSNLYLTGMWSYVGGGFHLEPQGIATGRTTTYNAGVWGANFYDHITDRPQEQVRLDGSYFFSTGSLNHELKFGAGYRTVDLDSNTTWPGNGYYLQSASLMVVARPHITSVTTDYWSGFLQDTLTIGRMTANIGLRWDKQEGDINASTQPAVPGFEAAGLGAATSQARDQGFTWNDITPRLGLTYALGAERKTLLRASYSRFADQLGQAFSGYINPSGYSYLYYYTEDANHNGIIEPGEALSGEFAGTNGFDPELSLQRNVVDPDLEAPLSDELLLSVEHALLPEFVVGLNFTYRQVTGMLEQERLVFCNAGEAGCFTDEYGDSVRKHQRSDYVLLDVNPVQAGIQGIQVTRPDGSTFEQSVWKLNRTRTDGFFLENGDREQEYMGAALTFNKRLANKWMLRGNFSWSDWTWNTPNSEREDPNEYLGGGRDGDAVLQGSGTGSGAKGGIYINSNWSYDLTGLYQIAPDRPWGFNASAHLYGREGYPLPFYATVRSPADLNTAGSGTTSIEATDRPDDYRLDDVHLMDLRLEKDFTFSDFTFTVLGEVFNVFNNSDALQRRHQIGICRQDRGCQGNPGSLADTNGDNVVDTRLGGGDYVTEVISPRVFRVGARFSFR